GGLARDPGDHPRLPAGEPRGRRAPEEGGVMTATAVAIAQFAPTARAEANLQHIEELVSRAAARGADLVLFPEYSSYFVDPFDESLARNAQDIDGPFVSGLVELASTHDVHLVAGLLERGLDGRRVRNTVVAVDATGV